MKTTSITLTQIHNDFITEWNNCSRYYDDMRRFNTGKEYADNEMTSINIKIAERDERFYVGYENSIRPHSVSFNQEKLIEESVLVNKILNGSINTKSLMSRLKDIVLNPLSESEKEVYQNFRAMGFGDYNGYKVLSNYRVRGVMSKEALEEYTIDRVRFYDLDERVHYLNKHNALQRKLNRGKAILFEIN
jgi:hypothetical protein